MGRKKRELDRFYPAPTAVDAATYGKWLHTEMNVMLVNDKSIVLANPESGRLRPFYDQWRAHFGVEAPRPPAGELPLSAD